MLPTKLNPRNRKKLRSSLPKQNRLENRVARLCYAEAPCLKARPEIHFSSMRNHVVFPHPGDLCLTEARSSPPQCPPQRCDHGGFYIHFMYTHLTNRSRIELDRAFELLEEMALGPPVSPRIIRAKTPTSASSPSLRSRDPVVVPLTPPPAMAPGGNVKVVVRVRGFLPRGSYSHRFAPLRTNQHT